MRLSCLLMIAGLVLGQSRSVVVIAHRGEHLNHTENTLPAFRAAYAAGADYFELDVQTTSDGKLVLMHDGNVDRTTNGKGQISEMTFEQVRALRAGGEPVPTFEEALELAHGKGKVYVDCKRVTAPALVEALERQKMLDEVVIYGGFQLLKDLQTLRPRIRVMPESVSVGVVRKLIDELRPPVIAFSARDWQDDIIKIAKASGADIYVDRLGQADQPEAWQDAVDRGATGIQTDKPAQLVEYLRSKRLHK